MCKLYMQTNNMDDATLYSVGNAIKEEMQRREREKKVLERFGEITTHQKKKNNRIVTYYMVYDGRRQITAATKEALIAKLSSMVEAESIKAITLEELFTMYYENRRNDESVSAQTSSYDLSNWHRFFFDKEGNKLEIADAKIADLTCVIILDFYKGIVKRGAVTKKAFNKLSGLMNGMFDYAIEKGIVSENVARNTPTRNLKFKPEKNNSNKVYRPEERKVLIKYLKSIPQTRYVLACRLMACLPLRMAELRGLTWEDYDRNERTLHVWHQIVKERRDGKERCDVDVEFPKGMKNSGDRTFRISREAAQVIEELRTINGDCHYILQGQGHAEYSMPENKINSHLKKYCEDAGVTYYSSHMFRFYGATELYKKGTSIDTIRFILGHSTIKMTMHYLRLAPEDADMGVIDEVFGDGE